MANLRIQTERSSIKCIKLRFPIASITGVDFVGQSTSAPRHGEVYRQSLSYIALDVRESSVAYCQLRPVIVYWSHFGQDGGAFLRLTQKATIILGNY